MKHYNVVAAIIIDGGKVFACQRGYGDWKGWWEFPGGKIEPGESPEQALIREIKEELEIDIIIGSLFTTVDYDYPNFHLTMHCYIAQLQGNEYPHLIEHDAAKWLILGCLDEVKWLPADRIVIDKLAEDLNKRNRD